MNKKLHEAPQEELSQVLRLVMLKLGIRAQNMPGKIETEVLLEHIRENFGGHTAAEIKLAWDMAISGKLDIDPKEVNCYENFSCLYFSKVMNVYRVWAQDQATKIHAPVPVPVAMTDDQYFMHLRENVEFFYQRLRVGYIPPNFSTVIFTEILQKDKLLQVVPVPETIENGLRRDAHTRPETPDEFFFRVVNEKLDYIYKFELEA